MTLPHRPTTTTPRLLALVAAALVALVAAAAARAETVVSRDNQGRPITFDVRATGTDVEWYAALLRNAAHGNEIATVTVRIVPPEEVASFCGAAASACYGARAGGAVIIVPAGRDDRVASILLHEYGHHVDQAWPVGSRGEPNGTPVWWAARGMEELLAGGRVAFNYALGWSRSVGEIFAEDYAYVHLGGRYAIPWLTPPDNALRTALLAELAGTPPARPATPAAPAAPAAPLVITRRGTLAPRAQRALPFGLLGPGRRVTFTATVTGERRAGTRARLDVVCDGRRVGSRTFARGQRSRTLDVRGLGPAQCRARLLSTSRASHSYTVRLRLALEVRRASA